MNGRNSRGGRREWSFRLWAWRSGERVCNVDHTLLRGPCRSCRATV